MSNRLSTARVISAKKELMLAVRDAVNGADLHRSEAEALLSGLFCDLWNQTERMLETLPTRAVFKRHRMRSAATTS
jgi:hypothetical protein